MERSKAYSPGAPKHIQLPILVWFVAISTLVACSIGDTQLLGWNLRGYAWCFQLIPSILILLRPPGNISFPWFLWVPWASLIILYQATSAAPNSLQRSIMMLCPIIVGMAASTFSVSEQELKDFWTLSRYMAVGFIVIALFKMGVLLTGALPEVSGLAAESMTAALLATVIAAHYAFGSKRALAIWAGLAAIPVVALTRTAIVASGLTLPLTLAPMKIARRLIILVLLSMLSLGLFYTERFQRKMFYSGEGTIEEVDINNPNLSMSGRAWLWDIMKEKIRERPWFGHGANSNEEFIFSLIGFYGQPHNDWLRLLFDYGFLGTLIFGSCLMAQVVHARRKARVSIGETRIFFYAGASSFLPFVLMMLTDNIILYAAFFGSLQFTILGLAYAAHRSAAKEASPVRRSIPDRHFTNGTHARHGS